GGYLLGGPEPHRTGGRQPGVAPASDLFRTSDGYITLSAYIPSHWTTLCKVLDLEHLEKDPRFVNSDARVENRSKLDEFLSAVFINLRMDGCVSLLNEAGIVVVAVNVYTAARANPDLITSGILQSTIPDAYQIVG